MRSGRFVRQPGGYQAFIPSPLPPDPPLALDSGLLDLLSRADRALGRLDGATDILPNPEMFVAMYVQQEAVLSSQIEGTQSSLIDVLEYQADATLKGLPADVAEVVNYVYAMRYGLERLAELPLSLRLIREIHAKLLQGVRGAQRSPGEFRRDQNWIGPAGTPVEQAYFVPPPPQEMLRALDDIERFLHDSAPIPVLFKCGLVHAQFETIHPFLDGNGRVGRLLTTFFLVQQGVLRRPLLYLSLYLKQHRDEYYNRLQATRTESDWEGWITFFLQGVEEVATQATETARRILRMREEHRQVVATSVRGAKNGLRLLDLLFQRPVLNIAAAQAFLPVTYPTASALISQLQDLGLLEETTGGQRNRLFAYRPYLKLFEPPPGHEQRMSVEELEMRTLPEGE